MSRDSSSTVGRLAFGGLLFSVVILRVPCLAENTVTQVSAKVPDAMRQQWAAAIEPLFKNSVATSAGAYNSGELLMVPLHAAFVLNDPQWEKEFADYFDHLAKFPDQQTDVVLSRLQFLYLASQFVVLAQTSGHSNLIPAGLPEILMSEIRADWLENPAWQWERPPFKGMRARIMWKLDNRKVEKSYFRAFLDEDFFLFAIAADLRTYENSSSVRPPWTAVLNDILDVTHVVCKQEIKSTPGGGWLLQPGVWIDHPDYAYAGNRTPGSGMQKRPGPSAAWDSSHFLRFPLWMTSLMNAYPKGGSENTFYSNLRKGLAEQFFSKVYVPPSVSFPCGRLNNFMDGSNGVYRWGYGSFGPNGGYGPYQLSGSLALGWWAFLGTADSKALYRELARQYPWPKSCVELYLGPPSRGRVYTQAELDPTSSAMRLRYVLSSLASQL
jgi:hypothetical protein